MKNTWPAITHICLTLLLLAWAPIASAGEPTAPEGEAPFAGDPEVATAAPDPARLPSAEKPTAQPVTEASADAADAGDPEEKDPPAHVRFGGLEVRGRAVVRGALLMATGRPASTDLSVDSARFEVRYKWRKWLRIVVEMELAGKPELKDGYIRIKKGMWGARLGHFKPPVSAIELESPWVLPVAERGVVTDVIRNAIGVAGRRPGLQAELSIEDALDLTVHVGVFQASDSIGDLLDEVAVGAQKLAGRVSIAPWKLEIGVFAELRPAEPIKGEGFDRFWSAGADLTLDLEVGRHGLRLWADVMVGSTWQDDDPFDGVHDIFFTGRGIGAWRYGGTKNGQAYGELFASFGVVDAEARIVDDALWEIAGGINAGAWKHLRFTLEARHRHASRNVPLSLGMLDPTATLPGSETTVVFEAGGAF